MISNGKDLAAFLQNTLKPLGFRKIARNWRLDTPETIVMVNLQRSSWGDDYYLNLGAFVKSISDDLPENDRGRPKITDCQFRVRLEDLFPDKPEPPAKITPERAKVHALLNLEVPMFEPAQRAQELKEIFTERLLPFLALCKTEKGIRVAIVDRLGFWYMASGKLRERLDIPDKLFGTTRRN